MFPLKDENPTERTPVVTVAIIVLNVLAWLFLQRAGSGEAFLSSLCSYGAIPGEISGRIAEGSWVSLGPAECRIGGMAGASLFSSMFMHGSWMHLIGNMWFLWVFGNNIEDALGHGRFVIFYLLAGLLASGAHILSSLDSGVPTVGASGAISGVMGAYIVLYPRVRVHTLVFLFYFIRIVALPAVALLGLWFLLQLVQGASLGNGAGVAFWAHIGGFAAGVGMIRLFARPRIGRLAHGRSLLTREQFDRWNRS